MPNYNLFFDTETTGLPNWKEPSGSPEQPHIVQLAAILADMEEDKIVQSLDVIIKPDGWTIPEDTVEIHGITNEMALDVGIPEDLALNMLIEMWAYRDRVMHNRTFDERIVRIGIKRYFDDALAESWKERKGECTMLMAKPIMQLKPKGKYGYENPSLSQAYEFFCGKELKDAHTAMADTMACYEIYKGIQSWEAAPSAVQEILSK